MASTSRHNGAIRHPIQTFLPQLPAYFLITCLLLVFGGLYFLFQPFLTILLLGAILATTFYPLYERLLRLFRNREHLAALVSCFLILFLIVIPTLFFVLLLRRQAVDMYFFIQHQIQSGQFDRFFQWRKGNFLYDGIQALNDQFGSFIDLQNFDFKKNLLDISREVSGFFVNQTADILRGLGGFLKATLLFLLNLFIFFFALFYFFKDGQRLTQKLTAISPLSQRHDLALFRKFKEISRATLFSFFLVSLAKGILGGVGFLIVGIPNPLLWGTAMGIFSILPIVGSAIIWLPAALILLATGQTFGGVFLLVWGVLLVSTIDNFLHMFFVGSSANLNPLLVFLAVMGGISLFGLAGILFGPLILTFFLALLHIYELEYKAVLKKKS